MSVVKSWDNNSADGLTLAGGAASSCLSGNVGGVCSRARGLRILLRRLRPRKQNEARAEVTTGPPRLLQSATLALRVETESGGQERQGHARGGAAKKREGAVEDAERKKHPRHQLREK